MVRNIIAKNLGKIQVDEIFTHKNSRISKGPDGLNIRGNIFVDDNIGIGTEYTNDYRMRIIGNVEIESENNNILNIKNNLNNILYSINNNRHDIYLDSYIHRDLNVLNNLNVSKIISNNVLRIPIYDSVNNKNLLNEPGSIIFNKTSNTYEGFNNTEWSILGGINPYEDVVIKNNLIANKNINILSNLNVLSNIKVDGIISGNLIGTSSIAYNLINVLNISKGGTGLNILGSVGQILQVKEDLSGLEWKDVTVTTPSKSYQFLRKIAGLYDNRTIDNYVLSEPNIKILNNSYEWLLIENYEPKSLSNTKQIILTINFSFYDKNLTSNIKIELFIDSNIINNQTIEEKIFSGNQKKNINKIFILNLEGDYKDLVWDKRKNINLKISDLNNSNNIKLFTYDGINLNKPKIIIEELGTHDGSIALRENLTIDTGIINNTIIGANIASSGSFTNIKMEEGDINKINKIDCNFINTNNIEKGLQIEFNGNNTKNIIKLRNNLEEALNIKTNEDLFIKIKTNENKKGIYFYKYVEGNDLVLKGNLTVNGNTNIISTTNTIVKDNIIELSNGSLTPINDAGILINRGNESNSFLGWDESEDKFVMGLTESNSLSKGNILINKGTLLANIEGNILGNLNGNALTANHSLTCNVATELENILPINRGGTGLNIIGNYGQILQVKNTSGELEWKTPTAIVSPKNYRVIETITGLYDNRVIKNYTLYNPNIQLLNNFYEWTIINNYIPPDNTTQIIFNLNFSIYDTNLNTNIKIEYIINNNIIIKQTTEEKIFSGNQKKNIEKTLIINLEGTHKDLDWISNNNVKVKITDLYNSNNIKLFTYDGININYPKITIQCIGIDDGNVSLKENISVNGGIINDTIIGINTPKEGYFTDINMSGGNIHNVTNINCNDIISNDIICNNITLTTPLSINNGGTGLNTIGLSGQVLFVNSAENGLEWKMIPQRSLQSNQILENLVGIYDNRIIKTYTLLKPSIITLNNSYEWYAINNYLPPPNTKEILINFDFSLYDTNLNTSFIIEYKIGDLFINEQTIEEKIFSANQQKNISKQLIVNLDGNFKDLDWNTPKNIIVKITDKYNTNNIKLFTYDGINLNIPKISIQAIGNNLGDISINQNLTINEGVINNTIIGETIPNKAYFTNLYIDGTLVHFTGSHLNKFNQIYNNNYIGYIVVSSGILNNKPTINKSLPIVSLSTIRQSKNVYGVISNKYNEEELVINSVGEGGVWIVNTNGNLENGDYIQTSNIMGLGEKQNNNLLYNYTVCKILHDCNFDINNNLYNSIQFTDNITGNIYIKSFVGCTYHCG